MKRIMVNKTHSSMGELEVRAKSWEEGEEDWSIAWLPSFSPLLSAGAFLIYML